MKMKRVWRAACAAVAISAVVPAVASAGWWYHFGSCLKFSDGSGYCNGTFLGFRYSSGTYDQAAFTTNDGYRLFYATYGATNVVCTPDATTSELWDLAMAHRGYFSIEWDAAANCTHLYLVNSSAYSY